MVGGKSCFTDMDCDTDNDEICDHDTQSGLSIDGVQLSGKCVSNNPNCVIS